MAGTPDPKPKPCKDCVAEWQAAILNAPPAGGTPAPKFRQRPAPHQGPRCATHWREEKDRRKTANHDTYVAKTYNLQPGDYDRLYALQGGRCALCQRATGATKMLAVDHDHRTGAVRGLLCSPCNQVLGLARDNPEYFKRALAYLAYPPAKGL